MNESLPPRTGLLVSVRSAAEACAAIEGGADLIDIKEPQRGALGAADLSVIEEVIAEVGERAPVSVALGEWRDWSRTRLPSGIQYMKLGLAGLTTHEAHAAAQEIRNRPGPIPVMVAYADHRRAASPDPAQLIKIAIDLRFSTFLIDTFVKDGTSLVDWLDWRTLVNFRQQLSNANLSLALAGSLSASLIRELRPVEPAWFAVRGAACAGGRMGTVLAECVRELRAIISNCEN
ncbi:MAG TPA: (5-formylfuran-3-yl)methyl phosphate synthase [Gemmataceae bacterium]|jgi:hypothetical protein|nr:(5-formylfuran-3-yl)methyl phosphate synthase [Gemmataceae bacterium]